MLAGFLVLAPAVLVLLALEGRPRVADPGPPDAAAVARARDVAESLRLLMETNAAAGSWTVDAAGLNGVLASARRVSAGLAGRVEVTEHGAAIELSAGAPILPTGLWANLRLVVAPSEEGLEFAAARIGRLPLPPALVEWGLRLAADRMLGDGLGGAALDMVAAVRIEPPRVTVSFDEVGRVALFERLSARVREAADAGDAQVIYAHLWWLDRRADEEDLPRSGSVLPYLRHAVEKALDRWRGGPPREELRAALVALMLYCGTDELGPAVGVHVSEGMTGRGNHCAGTTLGGRDDLKRHFVVSAGIQAASTGRTAFGLGELKELLDSNLGGSGFSFDDMAANAAGARFAETFLAAPPGDWPAMLEHVRSEADLLPPLDGLPRGLGEAEFRERYGDVDGAAYRELVADIDARVAALPLHRRFAAAGFAVGQ
jgi:hypothetical protein